MSEPRARSLIVVDDEPNVARVLSTFFSRDGWEVRSFQSPVEALDAAAESDPDVIVTDLSMPEMTGVELLERLRERECSAPLLVITAYGTVASAVEALKLGAFDYLAKPFDLENVKLAVQRAYLHRQLLRENEQLRQELQERHQFGSILGSSRPMQEVYRQVEKAARSRANVLILGESGTGKELVAKALHYNSSRANKRFVPVSCAALPGELLESELFGHEKGAFTGANWQRIGRFEMADGGTLFLDEIGDISLNVQIKLLRAIQEREIDRVGGAKPVKVDVRIVAATNCDLQRAIEKVDFREDLYYRLRVIEIHLPALRERKDDIPLLARHFLEKFAKRDGRPLEGFKGEALELLEDYDWPGNVRELENAVEHAVAMAADDDRSLSAALLPAHVRKGRHARYESTPNGCSQSADGGRKPLPKALEEMERTLLLSALDENQWDLDLAAACLGISTNSIRYSVRKFNLSGDRRRAAMANGA